MRTKLVYEDFKRNLPNEKIQARHRAEFHEKNKMQFRKLVEHISQLRKERAPYQKALIDFFNKEKLFNHLPPLPKPDPKGAKQRFNSLKAPNPPRLNQYSLDLSNLAQGTYELIVDWGSDHHVSSKILKL